LEKIAAFCREGGHPFPKPRAEKPPTGYPWAALPCMASPCHPTDRALLTHSARAMKLRPSLPYLTSAGDPCHPARSLRCRSARCSCVLTHSARASHLELRSRCCEAVPFASLPHVRTSWRPCAMIHVQCTLVNEQCTRKQGDVPPLRCITLLAHCTLLYKEAGRCAALRTDSASHSLHHDSLCKEARTRATRFAHCVTVLASAIHAVR
jgi:hypothetical protein